MADVSKIKLPNGTTYDIKDNISGYTTNTGTITKIQTTAGAHTTINVSSGAAAFNVPTKTSHLTNDSGFITNAGVTGIKGKAESSYRTGNVNLTPENLEAVAIYSELQTTNPFAPASKKGPYISKIDNAFYAADKRWTVTATGTANNDNVKVLFDGSYEGGLSITNGNTAVISFDFSNEADGYFPGYPYGYILVSFYYAAVPVSVSGRVYCNYESQGIGWHDIAFSPVFDSGSTSMVYRSSHQDYYRISQLEITIVGDTTNSYGYTGLTEIEMHLDRPDSSRTPFLSKYQPETLYYSLTAPNFIGNLTGNVQATTINGVTVGSSPKFTDTDEKVYQSYKPASGYTYWRPLLAGYSSGSAETFTPSDATNLVYTFNTLKVQPSTGTIRVGNLALYNGSHTVTLTPTTLTAGRTITVPDKTGTIALTSDITSAIEDLPEPMIFKGSVGSNGTVTWANLATAAAANEGWTYKVITAHTAETGKPAAQVGDTIISNGTEWVVIPSGDEPSGTVTSVAAANATNGGLTISGSPITSSGTITIGHSNILTSAQTTQAVYPIKIDKNGHISAYGSAVTIPTVPSATGSATTGITIAAHGTGTVIGVQSSTTTVRGVKTGTNSTTTASKVTLGTAISVPNVTGNADVTVPIRADADTTVPTAASSATTVPIKATSATTVPIKNTSATSIPNVTAVGSGSASLTFTMDTTDTKKLKITFSHTHTAPTLGTEISIIGVQSSTTSVTGVQSSTTSVTGVSGSTTVRGVKTGTNSTTTASKVTLGTAKSIPNVTAATDVTVPIRADADTTVPIKNTSASTFVTGTTHTVTDNGHTHTI